MVLQLHVWGPAFTLPSIDAQCLAAIAYCSEVLPKDSWELIASSDPSVSPTGELPALQNGSIWVSRFRNIVDYLRQYSEGAWNLDQNLDDVQKADSIAYALPTPEMARETKKILTINPPPSFSSFIESRGQSLLDLSLYVTSQNYYTNTSPAYGSLLQWPNQWILPPKLHSAAKTRTEHLGLSSLDLQAMEDQRKREHSAAVAAGQIPSNMIQQPRDTVSKLLGRTAQTNQFRLEALTADFFEPLEAMLARSKICLLPADDNNNPSSLDCVALGYLSLALVPELAFPWLRDAMRAKAPLLTAYTERMRSRCFGDAPVEAKHAFQPTAPAALPWRAPERISVAAVGTTLLGTLADNTPFLREVRQNRRLKQAVEADSAFSSVEKQVLSSYADSSNKDMLLSIATAVAGTAALVGYMVHVGLLSFSAGGVQEEEEFEEDAGVLQVDPGSAADFLGAF
ncbi:Mitochondrial import receptor subunit (Tom37) [Penicillium coprophilum]|uniref:Mitochondrial import receptor subunit (Tom37) n=1 Tax=Penicillium coprophilum TaxID=36646 RepID=UPI00239C2932|nr:Mitochondrial import receptor subunit (Tom37) [Penicillium coprophilum]KAJ5163194.1 Mitochondrial import receptor subunit (Tom37) [Penicillium coprophilum]